MKYIIAIGDGMADNPVDELGGKTPLEVANKPTIDELAKRSQVGAVRTVPMGMEPGSDTAILSIMGYNPKEFFSGRSPLEAAGADIHVNPGEIAYRCNMVSLDDAAAFEDKKILSHNGDSVEADDALALMDALLVHRPFTDLTKQSGTTIHVSPSFRHIAVQREGSLDGLEMAPPHEHLGEKAAPLLPKGNATAEALKEMMRVANAFLEGHPVNQKRKEAGKLPANGLWFWAEGTAIELPRFSEKYNHGGFTVSAVPLVRGIGTLAGLDYIKVDGATGELDTNYQGKALAVAEKLQQDGNDFAVLHVEAPDECTHNGDLKDKLQAIENFDSLTMKPLLEELDRLGEPYRILLLSDHKTLTATRGHDADPVPYLIFDSTQDADSPAEKYTEAECGKGAFVEEGYRLIEKLFQ